MATKNNAEIRAARKARFPVADLRAHVGYDPELGTFTRLIASTKYPAGSSIGYRDPNSGFQCLTLLGATQQAHRVAWALMTGEWPSGPIDFRNGDRADCRWCNLRLAKVGKVELTQAAVQAAVHYDPETGVFTWKRCADRSAIWNSRWAGKPAGGADKDGYVCISIAGNWVKAHRLAFLYMSGEWPPEDVDHADLNKANNRWVNLRLATRTQNNGNLPLRKGGSSGLKGAYWDQRTKSWCSRIQCNGVGRWLGRHPTREAAHAAYVKAAEGLFGEFARAG